MRDLVLVMLIACVLTIFSGLAANYLYGVPNLTPDSHPWHCVNGPETFCAVRDIRDTV